MNLDIIKAVMDKQGIDGIHLMAVGWEEIVPRIVTEAGLLPEGFVLPEKPVGEKKVKAPVA